MGRDRQSRAENYGEPILGYLETAVSEGRPRFYGTLDEFAASLARLGAPEDLFDDVIAYVSEKAEETGLDKRYEGLPKAEDRKASGLGGADPIPMSFGHVHRALSGQRPPSGSIMSVFVNLDDLPEDDDY